MKEFGTLVRSTRVYRTIPVIFVILVSAAFANRINMGIVLLILCDVLVYAVFGIHNAIKDNDFEVPGYSRVIMLLLLGMAVAISSLNIIVFVTVMMWIVLGLLYNTIARHILFGDSSVIGITHFALPSFSASLILGNDLFMSGLLAFLFFVIAWFLVQTKNLKDTRDDKKRGYVTMSTVFSDGTIMTQLLLGVSVSVMIGTYVLFSFSFVSFVFSMIIFGCLVYSLFLINLGREKDGLGVLRLIIMVFLFGLIFQMTRNIAILGLSFCLILVYLGYLFLPVMGQFLQRFIVGDKKYGFD